MEEGRTWQTLLDSLETLIAGIYAGEKDGQTG